MDDKVYILTIGDFSAAFAHPVSSYAMEMAQSAAKKIAIDNHIHAKAKIEPYHLNTSFTKFRYHEMFHGEQMQGAI